MAWVGICLLVLAAPFETRTALLTLPGQEFSSVELVLLAVVAGWLVAVVRSRERPAWRTPLTTPWIVFVLLMLVAAVASAHRVNALHMVGRLALACVIYVVAVNGLTTPRRRQVVMIAIVAGGAIAAALVVLEYFGVGAVLRWLRLFRPDVSLVGAHVRAGGPFLYPTIAAMYLEVAFAIGLGLLTVAIDAGRVRLTAIATVSIVLIGEAITLTFTRAGLLAMASSLCIVGGLRWRQHGVDRAVLVMVLIGAVITVQLAASRSLESLRLRLTTEGQESWYRADVEAPREMTLAARSRITVPVRLTNTGGNTWDPWAAQPFRLSYHWLLPDADRVVSWEGLRTLFPQRVPPGGTVTLNAHVEAPWHPGRYRLLWDIEQEHRLWFSTEPGSVLAISHAVVTGGVASSGPLPTVPLPGRAVRPGRPVLWRAALRMIADRPLLGVGPDNYRLLYGEYAGIVPSDPRIHSNNMYLEVMAGGGALGFLAFAWLIRRAAQGFREVVFTAGSSHHSPAGAGIAAAGVAIALHGSFDSFLSFTPTYVLIAVTLALATAGSASPITPHAHRV